MDQGHDERGGQIGVGAALNRNGIQNMEPTSKNKVYFLSDMHLGARFVSDRRAHERRVVAMLDAMAKDAAHIYMLGDVLDYWFEYKTVVPRGYVRFFGALARLADSGVKITWLIGNHDIWLFDYLRNEIGMEIVDGALVRDIDGKRFYLAHGDNLGKQLTVGFRFIRSLFRNRVCQKLYSGIHPRWTVPFAMRWSKDSRSNNVRKYGSWRGDDAEPAMIFAREYLATVDHSINYFMLGHRHLFVRREVSPTSTLVVLGDCYEQFTYARWDGQKLEMKHFDIKDI